MHHINNHQKYCCFSFKIFHFLLEGKQNLSMGEFFIVQNSILFQHNYVFILLAFYPWLFAFYIILFTLLICLTLYLFCVILGIFIYIACMHVRRLYDLIFAEWKWCSFRLTVLLLPTQGVILADSKWLLTNSSMCLKN